MAKKVKNDVIVDEVDNGNVERIATKKSLVEILKGAASTKDLKDIYDDAIVDVQKDSQIATDFISTNVATINLAFSGRIKDGGIPVGKSTLISTPSMFGKSFIALYIMRNAQKKGMNIIYLDAEDSFSYETAKQLKINLNPEVFQLVIENSIENLKTIIITMTKQMTKEERKNTLFILDSWNVLITSKSIENAIELNDKQDNTLVQKKNVLANLILGTRSTFFILNHIYDDITSMYGGVKVPGGRRIIHNCQCSLIGSSLAKETTTDKSEITGQIVTAKIHKSRYGKNQQSIQYRIKVDGGLDMYYGLLDDAMAGGYVVQDGKKYKRACIADDKSWWEKEIYCKDFWHPIFEETNFYDWISLQYQHSEQLDITKDDDVDF